jgi:NAD(P)-dependent dehydrogenase (short-subunit alcohol dehydrogenase family)
MGREQTIANHLVGLVGSDHPLGGSGEAEPARFWKVPVHIGFEGKGAIVTGGSRGIGLAIARALIDSGARVLITGRKQEALQAAAAQLGGNCTWRACHAADAEGAARCVQAAVSEFGALHLLVNNAGTNPQWGPTADVSAGLAAKLAEVNQWAPLLWIQLAWQASMRQHGGAVVNVTSIGGIAPAPHTGYYNATKAALNFLTRQLAAELAPAVRVNAVAPGMIDTDMAQAIPPEQRAALLSGIPLNRFGSPADIAAATLFLLSDQAAWITGQVLAIDGGMLDSRGVPLS